MVAEEHEHAADGQGNVLEQVDGTAGTAAGLLNHERLSVRAQRDADRAEVIRDRLCRHPVQRPGHAGGPGDHDREAGTQPFEPRRQVHRGPGSLRDGHMEQVDTELSSESGPRVLLRIEDFEDRARGRIDTRVVRTGLAVDRSVPGSDRDIASAGARFRQGGADCLQLLGVPASQ